MFRAWILPLAVCFVAQPAFAKGRHIRCELRGSSYDGAQSQKVIRRFDLYLDDSKEQVITESGPGPSGLADYFDSQTTVYSDTKVDIRLTDGASAGTLYFGLVVEEPALLSIDRTKGEAVLVAYRSNKGTEILSGPCAERSGPKTKF